MTEAHEPLSDVQVDLALKAAWELPYRHRGSGWDPYFVGHTTEFFLNYGPHCSVAGNRTAQLRVVKEPLGGQRERWFLEWRRPKKSKHKREALMIRFPVPEPHREWIESYLASPRPTSRKQYWRIMDRVRRAIEAKGYDFKVNPLRWRHTCAVRLSRIPGILPGDVQRLLGISPATYEKYVNRPSSAIAADLERGGYGQ